MLDYADGLLFIFLFVVATTVDQENTKQWCRVGKCMGEERGGEGRGGEGRGGEGERDYPGKNSTSNV